MLYHGLEKLRGDGPEQNGAFFESLGLHPGRRWAVATGWAECAAGALTVLGLATRPAALAVLGTQAFATWKVHRPKGFDFMKGGMEYNLALMAMALGLLVEGPRTVSASHAARRALRARAGGGRGLAARLGSAFRVPSGLERALEAMS